MVQLLHFVHKVNTIIHDEAELSFESVLLNLLIVGSSSQLRVVNCHHVFVLIGWQSRRALLVGFNRLLVLLKVIVFFLSHSSFYGRWCHIRGGALD